MRFLLEFKSFYKVGDIVLIHYWYNDMITPVIITETYNRKVKVTHNINLYIESLKNQNLEVEKYEKHKHLFTIFNAPDEEVKTTHILQHHV